MKTQLIVVLALLVAGGLATADNATNTLSMPMFNKLTVIEDLMNQQEYAKAQKKLNSLLNDPPERSTDKAFVYITQGTLNLHQEQYREAQKYYRLGYQQKALNEKTMASVLQTLANLAVHFGKYRDAVNYLQEYLSTVESPTKQIYLTLGTAYYQLKEYANAIPPLQQAMAKFDPDKSVHLMLFSAYYERHQLTQAAAVLEKVIRLWPDEGQYWLQLASIYLEQQKVSKSLEILQLAFTRGLLLKENELLRYVYALYEKGLPFKAATLLTNAMQRKAVKTNYKNTTLLATLYVDAREEQLALEAFKQASQYATDGKEDLYIAQIYFDRESYRSAIKYSGNALKKGVKQPGQAYMMLAASYQELDKVEKAKSSLRKASRYKKTKVAALQWLEGLETETTLVKHTH